MSGRKDHPLVGRWRIVKVDLWDRDHLDLCGPAMLTITAKGYGNIAYSHDDIGFTWTGCEEGDQVEGEGDAEIRNDGSIVINFAYRQGDEAVLLARRDTSSTAC